MKYKRNRREKLLTILVLLLLCLYIKYRDYRSTLSTNSNNITDVKHSYSLDGIPEYNGKLAIIINNNEPNFDDLAKTTSSFEVYSDLDKLGRCGVAYANIGKELMPTTKRDKIGSIKPSGWHTVKYDIITDGLYLYNRCHLIAYQLTAENANPKNLITCTRYANSVGMTEYELKVGDYIRKTGNHVLYRVTPIFEGNNLVASGIQMEALSIEDSGKGIKFNVYIYNIQPGIKIDYKTGESELIE